MPAQALAGNVSGAGAGAYILFTVEPIRRPQLVHALCAFPCDDVRSADFVSEGAVSWRLP